MEEVTFGDIDQRLAAILLARRGDTDHHVFNVTHQALATELGTAREVVSRHLKRFEARGWLQLGRGTIELVNHMELIRIRDQRK
jgi:CRP/FNR family transcriptional regulator